MLGLGGSLPLATNALSADIYKLGNNQRIACNRSLTAGKLQNISCKSFAYVLNSVTSEFYRCQVSVAVTRDNKTILKTEADGKCTSLGRIFPADSSYSFDATETEPPNTNAFFGSGGTAIWVSDAAALKVRGCIQLVTGIGPDLLNCVDMTFDPQK
ncbi:MAG: hypothetical protein EKK40_02385 [Bradyrhizobiaceae bacterium]|nr:MAG: hypothetical protein EKK40_02385 [Bradyrhizobiaceae bacterium]